MRNASDKIVEKIKTYFLLNNFFPRNSAVYEITWKKYGRVGQATDDNTAHAFCVLDT
jgi:hypothetical protein